MSTNVSRSPFRLLMILLSILAIATLVVASACGGDDDDDSGEDEPEATATQDAPDDDEGDDDDEETPEATEDDGDGDDEGDQLADLEDLVGEYQSADGVVTYELTSSDDDSVQVWTVYQQGDRSRIDIGDDTGQTIIITTPEASYTCSNSGGEGQCIAGEGGVGSNPFAGVFASFASYEAISGYLDAIADIEVDESSEDVAGTDASCFTAQGDFDGDAGSIKWCFADDGLLLLASYQLDSGDFEIRATDFESDVPGDAFDPPFDVVDLGDFGQ